MDKEEMIDFLISNGEFSTWTEDDRSDLEQCSNGALVRCCQMTELAMNDEDEDEDITANEDDDDDDDDMPPPRKKAMAKAKATRNAKHLDEQDDDLEQDDADSKDGQAKQRDLKGKKKKGKGGRIVGLQERTILKRDLATNEEEEEENDMTLNEWLDQTGMPTEYREMVEAGMGVWNQERDKLVDFIFNHENNEFTKEYLEKQRMPVLQGMGQLLGYYNTGKQRRVNFAGAAGGPSVTPLRNHVEEEPLVMPTLNWGRDDD